MNGVAQAFLGQLHALTQPTEHLSRYNLAKVMFIVSDTLSTLATNTPATPLSLGDHLRLRELAADRLSERASELMGNEDAATLTRQLAPQLSDLRVAVEQPGVPNTVSSIFGPIRLIDYLRANTILALDLAMDVTGSTDPAALAESVRALAGVLAERYPGRTIEVRVPPLVAIQIGAYGQGPTHTRGTPPNVVETDPATFLALATARQSWTRAVASGRLSASGSHANEAARGFPIYHPR